MESFEQKAMDVFSEIVINKSFVHKAGFGSRAIPTYVREWIISHYLDDNTELTETSRQKIAGFVQKFVPDKSQKETFKNQLFEQMEVQFLDNFSVYVNLDKGDRYLNIPFLDETSAFTLPQIVQDNEMLLSSGLWGVGTLYYVPKSDDNPRGQIWMREFRPFQLANMDQEYFRECRKSFTTQEWIDFLISSMGFNHHLYSDRQKILLICRLIPMVEPRYNLVELAPKGTGKSFVFENMSRYVAVRSGAISPAVLFFNDARKLPGLITRYDSVVIDEAQKVKADTSGELTALLKSYLEAGRFARGSAGSINAEAGLVMLANIDLDQYKHPLNEEIGLFRVFPNFLRETAFIDRFSGLLPGWHLPRISKDTPSKTIGLKGDIFGELLHSLRSDISYRDYVKTNMELQNCDDMRDRKAVEAGVTGLLKILFPDQDPSEEDFYLYCVNPALELRQRVRDELCKLDREYVPVTFTSKIPDEFQRGHGQIQYADPDITSVSSVPILEPETIIARDEEENEVLRYFGAIDEPENTSELTAKTIHIQEGDAGYSYQNLFGPYLRGSKHIHVVDPFIRKEYQIRNLIAFVGVIDTSAGEVELKLTTTAEDEYEEQYLEQKYKEVAESLIKHGILFSFTFDSSVHDRSINADNGWSIYPGRGFDFFQKPDSKYELSEIDQTKRTCKKTDIIYIQNAME
ncbi:MAG: BREX system Lon protease-like protein BrxL [Anaerolineaceae bacterium]|nr:BREX system Lon protease-like protein BrxL [Anaerolineaceae bacterium]